FLPFLAKILTGVL
uniref:Temporin-1Ca n=1 Tax=Lithobates clamitans TaxID=145282 RepID=TP1A_LITCL|nr:RecName: Full=Temporin-1Ca [Lithobates clamitans]